MSRKNLQGLIQTLEKTKETIKPDRDWLQSDRAALLSHVRESMPAKPIGFKGAAKALVGRVFPREAVQFVRGPMMAVIAVIAVVTGGSMASVSASGRSLPGDFLYPIKIATEQTRLALTSSKIERLELKVAFVERRVLELQAVADSVDPEKHEHVKATAGYLKRDLDTVERQIDEVKMLLGSVEAVKKLDGRITEIVSALGSIKDSLVDDNNKRSVSEAEDAAVNTSVKVVQTLIESKRNPETQNDVSDEELAESISSKVDALEQELAETAEKRKSSSEDEAEAVEEDAEAEATEVASDEGSDEEADATSASEELSQPTDDDDENLDEIFGDDPLLAAASSLEEARRLLENNELDEIPEKLLEAIAAAKRAEREAEEQAAEQEAQESSESDEQAGSGSDSTSTQETLDSSNSSTEATASSTET